MTRQELREQAAIEYCSGNKGADARVRGAFLIGAIWADEHPDLYSVTRKAVEIALKNLWHDAQGDNLPEIDREVIVLTQPYPLEGSEYAVRFAHRPVESYTGISITNHSEMEEYYPEKYDKGGWNIPDVRWWLDVELPNLEEKQ